MNNEDGKFQRLGRLKKSTVLIKINTIEKAVLNDQLEQADKLKQEEVCKYLAIISSDDSDYADEQQFDTPLNKKHNKNKQGVTINNQEDATIQVQQQQSNQIDNDIEENLQNEQEINSSSNLQQQNNVNNIQLINVLRQTEKVRQSFSKKVGLRRKMKEEELKQQEWESVYNRTNNIAESNVGNVKNDKINQTTAIIMTFRRKYETAVQVSEDIKDFNNINGPKFKELFNSYKKINVNKRDKLDCIQNLFAYHQRIVSSQAGDGNLLQQNRMNEFRAIANFAYTMGPEVQQIMSIMNHDMAGQLQTMRAEIDRAAFEQKTLVQIQFRTNVMKDFYQKKLSEQKNLKRVISNQNKLINEEADIVKQQRFDLKMKKDMYSMQIREEGAFGDHVVSLKSGIDKENRVELTNLILEYSQLHSSMRSAEKNVKDQEERIKELQTMIEDKHQMRLQSENILNDLQNFDRLARIFIYNAPKNFNLQHIDQIPTFTSQINSNANQSILKNVILATGLSGQYSAQLKPNAKKFTINEPNSAQLNKGSLRQQKIVKTNTIYKQQAGKIIQLFYKCHNNDIKGLFEKMSEKFQHYSLKEQSLKRMIENLGTNKQKYILQLDNLKLDLFQADQDKYQYSKELQILESSTNFMQIKQNDKILLSFKDANQLLMSDKQQLQNKDEEEQKNTFKDNWYQLDKNCMLEKMVFSIILFLNQLLYRHSGSIKSLYEIAKKHHHQQHRNLYLLAVRLHQNSINMQFGLETTLINQHQNNFNLNTKQAQLVTKQSSQESFEELDDDETGRAKSKLQQTSALFLQFFPSFEYECNIFQLLVKNDFILHYFTTLKQIKDFFSKVQLRFQQDINVNLSQCLIHLPSVFSETNIDYDYAEDQANMSSNNMNSSLNKSTNTASNKKNTFKQSQGLKLLNIIAKEMQKFKDLAANNFVSSFSGITTSLSMMFEALHSHKAGIQSQLTKENIDITQQRDFIKQERKYIKSQPKDKIASRLFQEASEVSEAQQLRRDNKEINEILTKTLQEAQQENDKKGKEAIATVLQIPSKSKASQKQLMKRIKVIQAAGGGDRQEAFEQFYFKQLREEQKQLVQQQLTFNTIVEKQRLIRIGRKQGAQKQGCIESELIEQDDEQQVQEAQQNSHKEIEQNINVQQINPLAKHLLNTLEDMEQKEIYNKKHFLQNSKAEFFDYDELTRCTHFLQKFKRAQYSSVLAKKTDKLIQNVIDGNAVNNIVQQKNNSSDSKPIVKFQVLNKEVEIQKTDTKSTIIQHTQQNIFQRLYPKHKYDPTSFQQRVQEKLEKQERKRQKEQQKSHPNPTNNIIITDDASGSPQQKQEKKISRFQNLTVETKDSSDEIQKKTEFSDNKYNTQHNLVKAYATTKSSSSSRFGIRSVSPRLYQPIEKSANIKERIEKQLEEILLQKQTIENEKKGIFEQKADPLLKQKWEKEKQIYTNQPYAKRIQQARSVSPRQNQKQTGAKMLRNNNNQKQMDAQQMIRNKVPTSEQILSNVEMGTTLSKFNFTGTTIKLNNNESKQGKI